MVKSDYDRFGKLIKDANVKIDPVKPTIALFTGDPAGIGPELVAKLLADGEAQRARGHPAHRRARRSCDDGHARGRREFAYERGPAVRARVPRLVDWDRVDATGFARGEVAARNGAYMLAGLALGLDLCAPRHRRRDLLRAAQQGGAARGRHAARGRAALLLRGARLHTARASSSTCSTSLWTSRVTSHVPLKDVSALITREGVAEGVALLTRGLQAGGHRRAAHRGVRTQPAQRRQRRVRPRGDRHDRARASSSRARAAFPPTARSPPTPRSCARSARTATATTAC